LGLGYDRLDLEREKFDYSKQSDPTLGVNAADKYYDDKSDEAAPDTLEKSQTAAPSATARPAIKLEPPKPKVSMGIPEPPAAQAAQAAPIGGTAAGR